MRGPSRASLADLREVLDETLRGQPAEIAARVSDQLAGLVGVLDRQHRLRRSLSDPGLPGEVRQEVADALLGSQLDEPTMRVVRAAVRARWSQSTELAEGLDELAAEAAFAAAEAADELDAVEDQLFRFGRIVEREPQLRAALTDPALPVDHKTALVHQLLDGKVSAVTLQLVDNALVQPRGRAIDAALGRLARMAARRHDRLIARVRAAVPLTEEQTARLVDVLSRTYGHRVDLHVEVDPSVLGGLVVRVGDEVIDGSIATRLTEAARRVAR